MCCDGAVHMHLLQSLGHLCKLHTRRQNASFVLFFILFTDIDPPFSRRCLPTQQPNAVTPHNRRSYDRRRLPMPSLAKDSCRKSSHLGCVGRRLLSLCSCPIHIIEQMSVPLSSPSGPCVLRASHIVKSVRPAPNLQRRDGYVSPASYRIQTYPSRPAPVNEKKENARPQTSLVRHRVVTCRLCSFTCLCLCRLLFTYPCRPGGGAG